MITRYERAIARRYLWPGKGEGIIALVASLERLTLPWYFEARSDRRSVAAAVEVT